MNDSEKILAYGWKYFLVSAAKLRMLFLFSILLLNLEIKCHAEKDSTILVSKKEVSFKREILPVSLIAIGSALNYTNFKYFVKGKIANTTNTHLDNYIQYAPIAELYISDLAGIKHKNSVWNQTKYLAISEIITSALVQSLKLLTRVERPNGGTLSFPSGHTSNAFTSATVLYEEFRDENLAVALSGYGFSTATGILRMTNNKHWISDVLAGAGIGILVAHLVYSLEPLKNWKPISMSKKYLIIPSINIYNDYAALGLHIQFK
jgi:membrane-associated phospholipid phosphatase